MLFKTTLKLAEYAEINNAVDFTAAKATIVLAEESHLIPILGKTVYDALNENYTVATDENTLSIPDKNLLERCRKVIGPYFAYYYAPKAEVKLSDAGLRREETNTSKTAFQYQGKNFREACLNEAEIQSENLIAFLEENKADYPDWLSSDEFAKYRYLFIKTGKEFKDIVTTASPYRNYYVMRFKMEDVEELIIRKEIGDELFVDLKTKAKVDTPSFTDKEKTLLFYIKKAIAYYTISFAIPFIVVRIDQNGLSVITEAARTSSDEYSSRANASAVQISHLQRSAADSGKEWLQKAVEFLNINHTDFPLFPYVEPSTVVEGCIYGNGSFGMV